MRLIELLVIEDNAGDATLIRQAVYYCSLPVRVHIARDGEQALVMLSDPHPSLDLILLDLNIPKISGTVLLERWKTETIPVVVFTSSTNPAEQQQCLALGARDFVSKPMDLQEFGEAVCRIVEKWAMPVGAAVAP